MATDIVREVLEACGIPFGSDDYGLEYNLCHAAIFGGLGIRCGSCESVKAYLKLHKLAPIEPAAVQRFSAILAQIAAEF